MRNNLHNYFKGRLENAEVRRPEGVWEKIEEQLPLCSPPWYTRYKYIIATLFFMTSSSIGGFLLYKQLNKPGKVIVAQEIPISNKVGQPSPAIKMRAPTQQPLLKDQHPSNSQAILNTFAVSAIHQLPEKIQSTTYRNDPANQESRSAFTQQLNEAAYTEFTTPEYLQEDVTNVLPANDELTGTLAERMRSANRNPLNTGNSSEEVEMLAINAPMPDNFQPLNGSVIIPSASMLNGKYTTDSNSEQEEKKADMKFLQKQKRLTQFKVFDITRGFHIGGFVGWNANWLTRKNDHLENPSNSIKAKARYGKSYGINIGYDYTSRWGFQLELCLVSEEGQRYEESSPKGKMAKNLNLNYLKFPLLVKYRIAQMSNPNSRPILLTFLAGPQLNFLEKSKLLVDGVPVPIKKGIINKTELGILVGVDVDFYCTRFLYVTLGARAGICSPMQRNLPMSFQLGFSTQLNFRKPAKN